MKNEKIRRTRSGEAEDPSGAEAGAEGIEEIAEELSELEERLGQQVEEFLANARAAGVVASRQIREHPLAAFGVAFVAGIAIARALRR